MRDPDRWNEKVELSLDGRQIFFLFFGSAVSCCLIFVAGVFVGKRIEQRALALSPPVVEDPLAALDQIDNEEADDGLTFHEALVREQKKHPRDDAGKVEPSAARTVAAPTASPVAGAPPMAPAHPANSPPAPHPSPPAASPARKNAPSGKGKSDPPARTPASDRAAPDSSGAAAAPTSHAAEHYTLQLSSFATEDDAAAFANKVRSAGFEPHVVESTVPGKGTFFRVRAGDFASRGDAAAAQAEYQRKQNSSAYIAIY